MYFKKIFLIILGLLSLIIGIFGIFIPLLPTTPFLLLTAACFCKSSNRLYAVLINSRFLGTYIKNYREHKAISLKAKVFTLTLLWGSILYSIFVVHNNYVKVLLLIIALGVSIHILLLKTHKIYN